MEPRFYSRYAICIATLFTSTVFGCILFAYNLKEIGRGKLAPHAVILGFIWSGFFSYFIKGIITNNLSQLLISNLSGSIILTFLCWNQFFSEYPVYERKNIWKPLAIFYGICMALAMFSVLAGKK